MSFNGIKEHTNVVSKSKNKSFYCDGNFEKILTIANVRRFMNQILSLEKNVELGITESESIKLTAIGEKTSVHEPDPMVYYFKADIDGKTYFVKHSLHPSLLGSGGYIEAMSANEAEKILLSNRVDWAEVVKFKLGYTDKKQKYYISEWCNLENKELLSVCLKNMDNEIMRLRENNNADEEAKRLEKIHLELIGKFEVLEGLFGDFFDFHKHNIFVDINSGRMYLFDLSKFPQY